MPFAAFHNCESLKKIIIPDTVTGIEPRAFRKCTSPEEIVIPASVHIIDKLAFSGCTLLRVTILSDVTQVEIKAFRDGTGAPKLIRPFEDKKEEKPNYFYSDDDEWPEDYYPYCHIIK